MRQKILNAITSLPNWLNNILMKLNKYEILIYGRKYTAYKKFIKKNYQKYDNSNDLIQMVNYAVEKVPYYRNRYNKINSIEEFKEQFKFIDKDLITNNFESLIAEGIDEEKYISATTGGTSGKTLKMYLPENRYIVELATMHTLWENVGFQHDMRAVIRFTKKLKFTDGSDYIMNPITKEVFFDANRLNEEYYQTIYRIIHLLKVPYIHAYPSIANEFSKFIVEKNLDISFVKSFLSGSENVYNYQKKLIRDKLGIKFYSWYGHSEKLLLGGYCKHSDVYHIEPTYGYFELIDENGKEITTRGVVGEIVGTTLHNYGMPMIRYKTGDYAEYVGDYCKHCQRHITLIKNIQGRRDGLKIYGADDVVLTTTLLELDDEIGFDDQLSTYLGGWQYVQKEKGKLDILIVKGDEFLKEHDERLKNYYKSKFSDDTLITIKYVDQLLRKDNGKIIELMSEIKE